MFKLWDAVKIDKKGATDLDNCVITSQQADETIGIIRNVVKNLYGEAVSSKLRIQYGGSMNPKNVAELMAMENIDGGLIGGASLKAPDFAAVVKAGSDAAK